ncbi:MAG TPA: O-antigen ligase family protein [Ktedonobacterales bacterium]
MSVPELMRTWRPHRDPSTLTLIILGLALVAGILATMADTQTQQWIIVALIIAIIFLFRRNEVMAGFIIVVEVLLDWSELVGAPLYWPLISLVCAGILLVVLFLTQSEDNPWVRMPYVWIPALILALGLYPTYHALDRGAAIQYYLEVLCAPMIMYVIGTQVTRSRENLRALLNVLTGFGAFIGLHSIIITAFGIFLFEPDALQRYLITVADYTLANSTIHRAASFLTNPDSNGAFLAMLLTLTLGLVWSANTWPTRILYGAEAALTAGGLICTFSNGSLLAFAPSVFLFILLTAGTFRRRLIAIGGVLVVGCAVLLVKPSLVFVLLSHATANSEQSLRLGAWETGIRVILSHPLAGVGLGYATYIVRAEPYRVALQYRPLSHPHDAFLELGAMAGIPLLLAFITSLALGFRQGIRLWRATDTTMRVMVAGILCSLLTLTFNSFTANAWTLPPLAMMGWLLIGAMSSPALAAREVRQSEEAAHPAASGDKSDLLVGVES